ncbi:MAG TPA: VCBS repeat-containing protein, partial [Candidatus Limnocylindrales bacterium]|nr:VCBS repeat-containing protein [Candidatus Limnocylindrales bacterium]
MTRPRPRIAVIVGATAIGLVGMGLAALLVGYGRAATPTIAGPVPHFADETATAGVAFTSGGGFEYAVGGGVAVIDCNDDGRPDLYVSGGATAAGLFRNDSPTGGALRFVPVHDPATDLEGVFGAYPIDIDGDGHADLVVLRNGENVLLRGLGNCRFQRANEVWGFAGGNRPTTAFSATWEGASTLPTMAFGRYADLESQDPTHLCYDNELFRPAAGRLAYGSPIPLTPSWCALSMLFSDWDRSGRMDLRVSNDAHYYQLTDGEEQLWRIEAGRPPRLYAAADGWVSLQLEGMGIASYDLTGDGYPDVYLTTQGANLLQTLTAGPSQPTYRDIGLKRGLNVTRPFTGPDTSLPSTAWHDEFADVNNDGFIDLFVSKGNVENQPDYAQIDPSNLLLGSPDGTFREAAEAAGVLDVARGRGGALVDFNLDGLLDLVEVHYRAPVRIWRNVGAGTAAAPAVLGNWMALRLQQAAPNVDAIG